MKNLNAEKAKVTRICQGRYKVKFSKYCFVIQRDGNVWNVLQDLECGIYGEISTEKKKSEAIRLIEDGAYQLIKK